MPRFADDFNVVFSGNIGHSQDFGTVTEAARLLVSDIKVNWVIVGEGDALPYLKQQNRGERLSQRIFISLGVSRLKRWTISTPMRMCCWATLRPAAAFSRTIPTKDYSLIWQAEHRWSPQLMGEVAEFVTERAGGSR